ncbi:MAG: hypothetical protein E7302_12700 [Butyrivibrio sp.]|nr:hypothetical protein [Butyrivibrio sp.]
MKKWNYVFDCPDQKKVRMIVYTDCKNEADDHKYIHKKNNRKIRVYNQVNARLILGDMFAKLKINFGNDNNDPNDRQGYRI